MYSALRSINPKSFNIVAMAKRRINDFAGFKKVLGSSRNIVVITGAGISAESGIPVFRGTGGLWRTYNVTSLAAPNAFRQKPSLVWEFYHHRRCVAFNAQPNKAHLALAKYEEECCQAGRKFHIITQNVDGLHQKAGSKNVIELHGALRKVRCTVCNHVEENFDDPICEGLRGRGSPNAREDFPELDISELPKCKQCGKLVRPHIVWFGESLNSDVLDQAKALVQTCDLCLVIGTSSLVYPAAMFAPTVVERGFSVAEFNLNDEPAQENFKFHFPGPCGTSLPKAFFYEDVE